MNILFIGYWAFHEGLTSSTILPHLRILSNLPYVQEIIYTSIERDLTVKCFSLNIPKVTHIPLYSSDSKNVYINKWHDFTRFPEILTNIILQQNITMMICRGAPAGALGYLVWKKTKTPFIVESFEPHGEYMLESGVWEKFDPRYILESYWEAKQKRYAAALLPVSLNYAQKLKEDQTICKTIEVMPCCVSLENFSFQDKFRSAIRSQYRIPNNAVVGIYVGKFGGIYLDEEAFFIFGEVLSAYSNASLFILSPDDPENIKEKIAGVPKLKSLVIHIMLIAHNEVPKYLSAADVAFATIKSTPNRKYCSAIKIGEYWANGLPVVITPGIGDDSEIIETEGGGVVYSMENPQPAIDKVFKMVKLGRVHNINTIVPLAVKYRSLSIVENTYKKILQQITL